MAKEYESSATGGAFSVRKTRKDAGAATENNQRFQSTLRDYSAQLAENNAIAVKNAGRDIQGFADLGKFSQKLSDKIVKDKQQKNLEEYEAGVADAYLNGIPQEEAEEFDKQEATVNAVGQETDRIGSEFAAASGSEAQGERISSSSGWRQLGRATGMAKIGAAQYPMFLAQNADRLAATETPEDYAATLNEIRKEYTGQFGGMNRAMMAKYMFPQMHETENAAFMKWQTKNNELIRSNRMDEMSNSFYADVTTGKGGQSFVEFIEKNQFHLGGKGKAREKLFEIIRKGVDSGEISEDDITSLEDYEMNFNGKPVKLGTQFSRDFDELDQRFLDRNSTVYNNESNERKIKQREIIDALRQQAAEQGGTLSDEQKKEALELWRQNADLGAVPNELSGLLTSTDIEEKDAREALEAKIKAGVPISEQDLAGLSADDRNRYGNVAKGAGKIDTAAVKYVEAAVISQIEMEDGEAPRDNPVYQQMNANAQLAFAARYNENLLSMNPTDALNDAKTYIKQRLDGGTISRDIPTTQAAKSKANLAKASKSLQQNPEVFRSQTIPGTEDALEELRQDVEVKTKSGGVAEIPQIYKTLASGMKDTDAWELASQQLEINGLPPLIKPQSEQYPDTLPPEVQSLFKYKPTPARSMRSGTVIEYLTGDRSHEGYREDHGGSNYHEHIAFDSPETTQAAIDLLEKNNIYVGSRNDGKHADTSYHYVDQAFDVPLYPNLERFGLPDNREGEEQFSAMVRDLLGKNGFGGAGIRASRNQPVSGPQKQFLDLVAGKESKGDYEAFNKGGSHGGHVAHGSGFGDEAAKQYGKPLTQMTVGEVIALGNAGRIHAAGRYQIINQTLKGLVKTHKIDTNALYDEEMQDQLALKLAYARLVRGSGITGLRNEWIGLHNVSAGQIRSSLGRAFNNPELLLKGVS